MYLNSSPSFSHMTSLVAALQFFKKENIRFVTLDDKIACAAADSFLSSAPTFYVNCHSSAKDLEAQVLGIILQFTDSYRLKPCDNDSVHPAYLRAQKLVGKYPLFTERIRRIISEAEQGYTRESAPCH